MNIMVASVDGSDSHAHYNKVNPSNGINNKNNPNRICRDFVRGSCRRKHCRYPHVASPDLVVFCHDFQNSNCTRSNCKFLHYTLQEEEHYRIHGEFPFDAAAPTVQEEKNLLPCKDYMHNGRCRHKDCYILDGFTTQSSPIVKKQHQRNIDCHGHDRLSLWNQHSVNKCDYRDSFRSSLLNGYHSDRECDEFLSLKRSASKNDVMDSSTPPQYKRLREEIDRIDVLAIIRRFEEEQSMLRRRVEGNEIKIAELRVSNEYLLAQNAQLRLTNVQCSAVVNPVTVTQTTSQPQTQLIGGVSIAPVQMQAAPIVSIATPQTQIIASSTTPLAIAANTTQGQQLAISQQNITSLTNATQQLASSHPQQILGTSQITLTPALAQGLTINTSQALAMSNATQPIISYPIMTHSILPH